MNIPHTLTTEKGQSLTQVAVASFRDIAQSQGISTLNRPNHNARWGYAASSDFFMATIYNINVSIKSPAPVTPFVAGFGSSAKGTTLWLDNLAAFSNHKDLAGVKGGTVGKLGSAKGGYVDISSLLIYGRGFTQADRQTANDSLSTYMGITGARDVLLCDGDSITEGYGSSLNQTWPRQIVSMLNNNYRVYNTGSFGQTSKARLAYMETRWERFFPDKNARNVLVEFSGTNDLGGGAAAGQIYSNFVRLVELAREHGVKTVLLTVLPRTGFVGGGLGPAEVERLALNAMIRGNEAKADRVADVAADPVMGAHKNLGRADCYLDGVHPVSQGLSHIARIVAQAVNEIW